VARAQQGRVLPAHDPRRRAPRRGHRVRERLHRGALSRAHRAARRRRGCIPRRRPRALPSRRRRARRSDDARGPRHRAAVHRLRRNDRAPQEPAHPRTRVRAGRHRPSRAAVGARGFRRLGRAGRERSDCDERGRDARHPPGLRRERCDSCPVPPRRTRRVPIVRGRLRPPRLGSRAASRDIRGVHGRGRRRATAIAPHDESAGSPARSPVCSAIPRSLGDCAAGPARAASFTWERCAEQHVEAYAHAARAGAAA
jgi:hypothetical protein